MLHCLVFALASTTPLSNWLVGNGAILSTSVDVDANGLRGLKWNNNDNAAPNVACRIPQKCTIVADDVNSLACTVLKHYELGDASEFAVYLDELPETQDLGSSWTDAQLDRLLHGPTKRQFTSLRDERMKFINSMLEAGTTKDEQLAGRAYDLVFSRAVEGRFGRRGTVRAAYLAAASGLVLSIGLTVGPLLFQQGDTLTSGTVEISVQSILPMIASLFALGYALWSQRDPELALVPWLDYANHNSASAPSVFQFDILNDAISWKAPTTGDSEWATFNYGGSAGVSNDRLLGEYGFVEIDNPNDKILLDLTDDCISIGRNGKIREAPDDRVLNSARKLRDTLAKPVSNPPDRSANSVDIERSNLADLWRQEKIRLLDEFLCKYSPAQEGKEATRADSSRAVTL